MCAPTHGRHDDISLVYVDSDMGNGSSPRLLVVQANNRGTPCMFPM